MKKTIPIEIVLQDPNDPIVPTPDTPSNTGTGTTETSIAVPNTGDGTDLGANNNGMFSSSAATTATIASIVVLVLTIVAAIVLAVRRYHKRKTSESGITRQERRATIVTSTIAVLALTVLLGQLLTTAVVQPNSTNAAAGDNSTSIATPDKIQIVANRYDDVTIVASTKAISYASTTTSFGYKIFMSMAGEDANLYLDGDTTSEYYFAPTSHAGLDNNSWGYNFDGEADYTAMPLVSDPLMAQQTLEAVEDEEFTVYYTMKADKDMPFGVYSGEVTYDIEGYNGFPTSLTNMQDMTPEICDAVYTPSGTETIVPTATLVDTRDQKTYEIAKLADGNCWMTQNLDLDLNNQTTLTPANTNITANWTPVNSTISFTGTTISGWNLSSDIPYSADPGDVYYYSSGTTDNDTQYTSLADCQAEHPDCSMKNHAGNYYNWSAAVATNDTSSYTTQYENMATSICPAGWRLPTGRQSGDDPLEGDELGTMIYSYDIAGPLQSCGGYCLWANYLEGGFNALRIEPLWIIRPGAIYYGSPGNIGSSSYYWSSTILDNSYASNLQFYPSDVRIIGGNRFNGYSVRCLAE